MVVKISKTRFDAGNEKLQNAQLEAYTETTVTANSSTSYTIDLSLGNSFSITLTANCLISITGAPTSGIAGEFTLLLTQDATGGRTVSWPTSVIWANSSTPTIATTSASSSLLKFTTVTGGTYWYGTQTALLPGGGLWAW